MVKTKKKNIHDLFILMCGALIIIIGLDQTELTTKAVMIILGIIIILENYDNKKEKRKDGQDTKRKSGKRHTK